MAALQASSEGSPAIGKPLDLETRPTPPATPRWVVVSGIITAAVLIVIILLHLTGRGFGGHG